MKSFLLLSLLTIASSLVTAFGNFNQYVSISWGNGRGKILEGGNLISLSLDKDSGSGFQSNTEYLFGRFDMEMKLVPGDSAGTVTTFYLSSDPGPNHDEIDFEFLGNQSGSPYTLHTNVFTNGKGSREQEFKLWFDPTLDFHLYSILWNPHLIMLIVDHIPIRVFENKETIGVPYANSRQMRLYATIWDADEWATLGGRVKADWSKAPFTAYYRNFSLQTTTNSIGNKDWLNRTLTLKDRNLIRWVQKYHMIYNYCVDPKRRLSDRRECVKSRFS